MARYIDADELIADGWHLERHAPNGRCLTMMSIADVPTADVEEVKHGEWIHEPPYYAPNGKFLKGSECSNCHSIFVSDANEAYSDHPFCCECGAKMGGGKAE